MNSQDHDSLGIGLSDSAQEDAADWPLLAGLNIKRCCTAVVEMHNNIIDAINDGSIHDDTIRSYIAAAIMAHGNDRDALIINLVALINAINQEDDDDSA